MRVCLTLVAFVALVACAERSSSSAEPVRSRPDAAASGGDAAVPARVDAAAPSSDASTRDRSEDAAASGDAGVTGPADAAAASGRDRSDAAARGDDKDTPRGSPDATADASVAPADASSPDVSADCSVTTIDKASLSSVVFALGSVTGGRLAFRTADQSSFVTLGALQHKFRDHTAPVLQQLSAAGCREEQHTTLPMHIASEDTALLSEDWQVNVHVLPDGRVLFDYEADVSTLSEPVRNKLSADPRTATFERMRFDFESGRDGRAMLFHRDQPPGDGIVWFDFKLSCAPPSGDNARMCSIDHPAALDPAAVECAASAVANNNPFVYVTEVAGKATLVTHIGSLDYKLVQDDNKGFFEMQVTSTNQSITKVRRCAAVQVTNPCTDSYGSCATCVDEDPWLELCNQFY